MTIDYEQDDMTAKHNDYAVFLPAISGFYSAYIGKQRAGQYVDQARMPAQIQDMEMLNWYNSEKGLFPYKWSLYSGGHANLDLSKEDPAEDMVRKRDPNTWLLADSGGFQIVKGLWEGDWRAGSGCPKAQAKRDAVLRWMDDISDYGMILDIPTRIVFNPKARKAANINTYQEAVDATKFNNDYFIKHRKGIDNGGTRFLNVLQGASHPEADMWYEEMKGYCDPKKYPGRHFDGWAMGGQNMCDAELVLKRLVALRFDNLLQEGKHDWMHFLGTSRLEWAVLFTDIQRAIRKYVNPNFTISFDCASPFLATANGQIYHQVDLTHNKKWSYRMSAGADHKKYATDTRNFADALIQDGHFKHFDQSPVSSRLMAKDICVYHPGVPKPAALAAVNGKFAELDPMNEALWDVQPTRNKIDKVGKTSWDSFSYALMMGHNVWTHIYSVQEANRRYDQGDYPKMLCRSDSGHHTLFKDIVEAVFSATDRAKAEQIIEYHKAYFPTIHGSHGFKGKNQISARYHYTRFFDEEEVVEDDDYQETQEDFDESKLDALEATVEHGV